MGTDDPKGQPMDIDDQDGFGPVRTEVSQTSSVVQSEERNTLLRRLFEVQLVLLIRGPLLESLSGEPTRDRDLVDKILGSMESNPEWFQMMLPIILREIELGALEFTDKQLDQLLYGIGQAQTQYPNKFNEEREILVVKTLSCTMNLWAFNAGKSTKKRVRSACNYLSGRVGTYKTRDAMVLFVQKVLALDPTRVLDDDEPMLDPMELIQKWCEDDDIRVRFRCAITLPRLFGNSRKTGTELMTLYTEVKDFISSEYERYITPQIMFLCANIFLQIRTDDHPILVVGEYHGCQLGCTTRALLAFVGDLLPHFHLLPAHRSRAHRRCGETWDALFNFALQRIFLPAGLLNRQQRERFSRYPTTSSRLSRPKFMR